MKRTFLAIALSIFTLGAMAQVRPSVIVSAGYQGANISTSKEGDKMGNSVKSGFRVGAALDLAVADLGPAVFSIQPGLYYSTKGAKSASEGDNSKGEIKTTLGYVELPILANFAFNVADGFGVFVNAGPYLAYGVNTTTSGSGTLLGITINSESKDNLFKEDGGLYKPFDAGIQVGAGAEYRNILLGVGSQFGLADMSRVDNLTQKNINFFVSLGYRF
ncbi:MAG: porin family protein [Porphyromonas sp.]|nr:porin family protein [Porphyromonas sp.]